MRLPFSEQVLRRIVERVEIPCVNEQGALIDNREVVLEDVKAWIADIDERAYYIPGGAEQFRDDLDTFLDAYKGVGEFLDFE